MIFEIRIVLDHVVVQGGYEMFLFMESSQHASLQNMISADSDLGQQFCSTTISLLCLFYKFMIDVYMRGLMLLRLP